MSDFVYVFLAVWHPYGSRSLFRDHCLTWFNEQIWKRLRASSHASTLWVCTYAQQCFQLNDIACWLLRFVIIVWNPKADSRAKRGFSEVYCCTGYWQRADWLSCGARAVETVDRQAVVRWLKAGRLRSLGVARSSGSWFWVLSEFFAGGAQTRGVDTGDNLGTRKSMLGNLTGKH